MPDLVVKAETGSDVVPLVAICLAAIASINSGKEIC